MNKTSGSKSTNSETTDVFFILIRGEVNSNISLSVCPIPQVSPAIAIFWMFI